MPTVYLLLCSSVKDWNRSTSQGLGTPGLNKENDISRLQGERKNRAYKSTGKAWEYNLKGKQPEMRL